MPFDNSGFHRSVAAEMNRQNRLGYNPEHDDQAGVDHLLELAYQYVSEGKTVKGAAMIIAARSFIQRNEQSNIMQRQIAEFMNRCDQEVANYPKLPTDEIRTLRIRLMVEELLGAVDPNEFLIDEDGKLVQDIGAYFELLIKNKSNELVASMLKGDLVGVADGIADVLYVVIGTAVAYGINIQDIFNEVHRSNLSKTVWNEELGRFTIEKDQFGKGLKPATYSPANIEPIIQRQISAGKVQEYIEFRASDPQADTEKWEQLNESEQEMVSRLLWSTAAKSRESVQDIRIPDDMELIEIEVPDNV